MKIAIIGASKNRQKYGNKAIRAYLRQDHTVYPVNPNESEIEGLKTYKSILDIPDEIDRASIYLPPHIVLSTLDEIAQKGVKELFFNPGSESRENIDKAEQLGLNVVIACSIIDIGETP
ncbi:CoA-binding protein [candidate division KSB1 bacterium]